MFGECDMKRILEFSTKLVTVIPATLLGMVMGAVILWIPGYVILDAVFPPITNHIDGSEECARGNAIGFFAQLLGGLIGGIISLIAMLKSICSKRKSEIIYS